MLKIIAGMAAGGYGWNLREWQADRYKQVKDDLDRSGIRVSDNTLRKYLSDARKVIEDP